MKKLKFELIDVVPRVPNRVFCNRNLRRHLMEFLLIRNFFQRLARNSMKVPIVMLLAIDVLYTRPSSNNEESKQLICNRCSLYIIPTCNCDFGNFNVKSYRI